MASPSLFPENQAFVVGWHVNHFLQEEATGLSKLLQKRNVPEPPGWVPVSQADVKVHIALWCDLPIDGIGPIGDQQTTGFL